MSARNWYERLLLRRIFGGYVSQTGRYRLCDILYPVIVDRNEWLAE